MSTSLVPSFLVVDKPAGITSHDVVDVIRDEAEHSFMSAAGLDEEDDMFAPATKSAWRRAIWLGYQSG